MVWCKRAPVAGPGGLVLLDQLAQHLLAADGGEDDVAHDTVGLVDRGLGQLEQQASLAGDHDSGDRERFGQAEPLAKQADDVYGDGSQHVLQMCLREPTVARLLQTEDAGALGKRPFDPGSGGVLRLEGRLRSRRAGRAATAMRRPLARSSIRPWPRAPS